MMLNASESSVAECGPSSQNAGPTKRSMRKIFQVLAMPDTGLFHVIDLEADRDERGHVKHVDAIAIRCNKCRHVTRLGVSNLETMPGGTLLACAGCGERQAVSNARLVECDTVLTQAPPRAIST